MPTKIKNKAKYSKKIKLKRCCANCTKSNSCVIGSKESMECVNKRHKNYVPNWK